METKLPSELEPERCAQFVTYLHNFRKESGVAAVTDAEAVQAFDIIENFCRDFSPYSLIKRA